FALQPIQLVEVHPPIHRFPVGMIDDSRQELVEAIVVDLHLQLFVQIVGNFLGDAGAQRISVCWSGFVHRAISSVWFMSSRFAAKTAKSSSGQRWRRSGFARCRSDHWGLPRRLMDERRIGNTAPQAIRV